MCAFKCSNWNGVDNVLMKVENALMLCHVIYYIVIISFNHLHDTYNLLK